MTEQCRGTGECECFRCNEVRAHEQSRVAAWLRTTPRARGVLLSIESSQDIARLADAVEAREYLE